MGAYLTRHPTPPRVGSFPSPLVWSVTRSPRKPGSSVALIRSPPAPSPLRCAAGLLLCRSLSQALPPGLRFRTALRLVAAGAPLSQAASPALAPLALRHQPQAALLSECSAPRPQASCAARLAPLLPLQPPQPRALTGPRAPHRRTMPAPPTRRHEAKARIGNLSRVGRAYWLALPPPEPSPQVEPFRLPTSMIPSGSAECLPLVGFLRRFALGSPLDPPSPPAAFGLHRFCVAAKAVTQRLRATGERERGRRLRGRGFGGLRFDLGEHSFGNVENLGLLPSGQFGQTLAELLIATGGTWMPAPGTS